MKKKKSNKDLKKELWETIRKYFLLVSPKNKRGFYYCPLRDRYYPKNKMDVAHYIDRGFYATRWDIDNLLLVSSASNRWDAEKPSKSGKYKSLHHEQYAQYIGEDRVKELEKRSKSDFTVYRHTIEEYIDKYKKLIEIEDEKKDKQSR